MGVVACLIFHDTFRDDDEAMSSEILATRKTSVRTENAKKGLKQGT